jgi:hypothetical protein
VGDVARAEERLGEAVRLAAESGHDDTAQLLAGVVDVLDVKTGTVRLRADADKAGTMALDARGTRTVQVGSTAPAPAPVAGASSPASGTPRSAATCCPVTG